MKINYKFFIIIILFVLLSGCSKDAMYFAIYESLYSMRPPGNPTEYNGPRSYEAYRREREKMLKKGQIIEEQRIIKEYQNMSKKTIQEERSVEVDFLCGFKDISLSTTTEISEESD